MRLNGRTRSNMQSLGRVSICSEDLLCRSWIIFDGPRSSLTFRDHLRRSGIIFDGPGSPSSATVFDVAPNIPFTTAGRGCAHEIMHGAAIPLQVQQLIIKIWALEGDQGGIFKLKPIRKLQWALLF